MDPTKRDLPKDTGLCEGLDHGCFLCGELERIERLAYQVYAHRLEEELEGVKGKGRKGRTARGAESLQIALWQGCIFFVAQPSLAWYY